MHVCSHHGIFANCTVLAMGRRRSSLWRGESCPGLSAGMCGHTECVAPPLSALSKLSRASGHGAPQPTAARRRRWRRHSIIKCRCRRSWHCSLRCPPTPPIQRYPLSNISKGGRKNNATEPAPWIVFAPTLLVLARFFSIETSVVSWLAVTRVHTGKCMLANTCAAEQGCAEMMFACAIYWNLLRDVHMV